MAELCASILAANHAHIARDVKAAEAAGIHRFHIDVSDGRYTGKLLFGDQLVRDLRSETTSILDAHLAVYNGSALIDDFIDAGADCVTIQYETSPTPLRTIHRIRTAGRRAAMSFVPSTPFDDIRFFLDEVDMVSILGVEPGIGGQTFNPKVLRKLERIAQYKAKRGLSTLIAADGGLNPGNLRTVLDAGIDIAILGSGVFSGCIEENARRLKEIIRV